MHNMLIKLISLSSDPARHFLTVIRMHTGAAGRQSSTALGHPGVQSHQGMSRSLDLERPTEEEVKQGQLGISPELAAWWGDQGAAGGMEGDPLQGWLRREQQARAVYKRWDTLRCCLPTSNCCVSCFVMMLLIVYEPPGHGRASLINCHPMPEASSIAGTI